MVAITEHEQGQIGAANASGKTPIVFVHGLWLLPSSWDRWRTVFEEAGYSTLAPGWPDDPDTVAEANRNPKVFAGKSIKDVADHFDDVIRRLTKKPAIVGHSFGGLLTQILAGRGLSAASVAIDPAPFRGVLPLPISALRSSAPVLTNPLNYNRAVPLTYEQFRYAFANAVGEDEAHELYDTFAVPAPGEPLFQAAAANLNPWTKARSTRRTPTEARCSSSTASSTTPCLGDRECLVQPPEAERRRHRDRQGRGARPCPDDRQRLARRRRPVARFHPPVRPALSATGRPGAPRCPGRVARLPTRSRRYHRR